MCVIAVIDAAPCQCFSLGGNHTTSPGLISSTAHQKVTAAFELVFCLPPGPVCSVGIPSQRLATIEREGSPPRVYLQNLDGSDRVRLKFERVSGHVVGNYSPRQLPVTDESLGQRRVVAARETDRVHDGNRARRPRSGYGTRLFFTEHPGWAEDGVKPLSCLALVDLATGAVTRGEEVVGEPQGVARDGSWALFVRWAGVTSSSRELFRLPSEGNRPSILATGDLAGPLSRRRMRRRR